MERKGGQQGLRGSPQPLRTPGRGQAEGGVKGGALISSNQGPKTRDAFTPRRPEKTSGLSRERFPGFLGEVLVPFHGP